ncbi:toll-like receptor 13 [Centruroides sculpturatus]|uniref:toll-like receptor 13 n=1 Tax=Centruroides sculpturatus TaxID=218467 RepID=UPI000C6D27D1|nr:toll-like receptor 13 [Centruroides sculpturatus]XP_023236514.1 toll-like receptor 13 [Centruroides sculpturatus]
MMKFILILIASLPFSSLTSSLENAKENNTSEVLFEGLTLHPSNRHFTNFSELLEQELKNFNYPSDFDNSYYVDVNQTKNEDVLGCVQTNTILKCKNVDIFEIAERIPATITHLQISNSPVQILRTAIFENLTSLITLELTNNSIQYVTSKFFQGLEQLLFLNFSTNNIRSLTKKAFSACPNLRTIDLSENRIISLNLIPAAFSILENLTTLILSNNNIRRITKTNLIILKNSPVKHLDLSYCDLLFIERGSFGFLQNLETLNLTGNKLDEESLFNATSNLTSIRILDLRSLLGLKGFPKLAISALRNTSIQSLDLSYNLLQILPNNSFTFLPNLTYLRLINCEIKDIEKRAFEGLVSVEILDLSANLLEKIPSGISILSNLRLLYLYKQYGNTNYGIRLYVGEYAFANLSLLSGLLLTNNNIKTVQRFAFHNLVNLRVLIMSNCDIGIISDHSFSTLTSLETLDLSNNKILFFGNNTLRGLRNLKVLSVRNNGFFIGYRVFPFIQTPSLEKLFISGNKLTILRHGIFSNMPNLKLLDVENNEVTYWNYSIFQNTTLPDTFILSNNEIDRITPIMFDDLKQIRHFDLSQNPYDCHHCSVHEFKIWLRNNENKSLSKPTMYACSSPQDFDGQSLMILEFEYCLPESIIGIINVAIGVSILMILLIIFVIVIVRYKWYFRYMCFHLHSTLRRYSTSSHVENYEYDAFVSYNSVDVAWVAQILMPNLESHHSNFRLCIHDRDFEVGKLITENILDSIDKSRKVLLILTDSFVKSQWCMYELHVAQHQLFHYSRDALVFVQVGPIDRNYMSKNLKYLLKTRTYLIWPEDPDKRSEFWSRLHRILTT